LLDIKLKNKMQNFSNKKTIRKWFFFIPRVEEDIKVAENSNFAQKIR
jgi:hypothetical protein